MGERIRQVKIYFNKFMRLFVSTGGWKAFIFGGIISLIIVWVVGDDMYGYYTNTRSGCFTMVSACIWVGIFNSIQSVCKERDIIKREHRTGMHISSYIVSRAIYELIVCIIQAAVMLLICVIFLDMPEESTLTGNYLLDCFLIFSVLLLSADYLGIAVSSIVKTTTTAMTVMPFILIVQLVLSGVLFELEGAADKVAKITISRWGMEALGAVTNINALEYSSKGPGLVPELEIYAYEADHIWKAIAIVAAFAVAYIAIAIISLEFVDKDKR